MTVRLLRIQSKSLSNMAFVVSISSFLSKLDFYIVKLREREGQRVDLGRSLKGHLLMVDGGWWISFP